MSRNPHPLDALGRRQAALLAGTAALVLAPHWWRLPAMVTLPSVAALGLWTVIMLLPAHAARERLARNGLGMQLLRAGIALGALFSVYIRHVGEVGRDAGVEFLVLLTALKFFELRTSRDRALVVCLGFILVGSNYFYDQSPLAALWGLAALAALMTQLARNEALNTGLEAALPLRAMLITFLYALPVAIVVFLLFPRIPGPLWGNVNETERARTGLSSSLSMGAISELISSGEVAFHATFDGDLPPPAERYWRALILSDSDGRQWRTREPRPMEAPLTAGSGSRYRYTIEMEAHGMRFVPALDYPVVWPEGYRAGPGHSVVHEKPIDRPQRLALESAPRARFAPLSTEERARYTALPAGAHPKTHALAAEWRTQMSDPAEIVEAGLSIFREAPFRYTLRPPKLTRDPVDEFLFSTQTGFCEHFASAFVTLMRAAGVPARIVTGYQGGEYSPMGDYLLVRQRDAHAWAEVWLDAEGGWLRRDPTAMVAPERVETGIDAYRGDGLFGLRSGLGMVRLMTDLSLTMDYVRVAWNRWVVGYDNNRQRDFLRRVNLGVLSGPGRLGLSLMGFVGLVGAVFLGMMLLSGRHNDPVLSAYERFLARCERAGLVREPGETAGAFASRARRHWPEDATMIAELTQMFEALRYAQTETQDPARIRAFRGLIRSLRLRKRARHPLRAVSARPSTRQGSRHLR